ncbi:uncharacterized protein LOC128213132 [Mya arenaria]|uniref:uncharacterized protein LOC128213132 n=1 Tax=Mya arenaria TaxID=6604 RepID=UPI0022E3A534|nr:uncharacterized protein LOC128213132 [Mya arenaria]
MVTLRAFLRHHRGNAFVPGFLAFFIVAYVIIVKMDNSGNASVNSMGSLDPRDAAKVIRTHINSIPAKVMQEFAQDRPGTAGQFTYDFYDDADNVTEYDDNGSSPNSWVKSKKMKSKVLPLTEPAVNSNLGEKSSYSKLLRKQEVKLVPSAYSNNLNLKRGVDHKFVHVFNAMEETLEKRNTIKEKPCLLLKTHHLSSPICTHDPADDEIISGKLSTEGTWEGNYLYIVGSILSREPELHVLDLGCNIGVYTIFSAKLKHRVVALDPNKMNLRLLTKSLNMGGLTRYVTLLWNAISNVRENVTLYDIIGNIGGSFVDPADDITEVDDDHRAVAITLDDLIPYFAGKPVFIKMDVETYELKALQGGEQFFRSVHVRFVLLEWIHHREFDTGKDVIRFMTQHGLFPHVNAHRNTRLEPQHYTSWPDNVLWIKY